MLMASPNNRGFDNLRLIFNNERTPSNASNRRPMPLVPAVDFLLEEDQLDLSTSDIGASQTELPNEFSSTYMQSSITSQDGELGATHLASLGNFDMCDDVAEAWSMNYHEAAIYLEEGLNNDKFDSHPRSREALPTYLYVHNHCFYLLDLLSSYVLLALALIERPAIPGFRVHSAVHASLELCALAIVSIELFMKFRWMGIKPFFNHTRTVLKLATLGIMILEAFVVLVRRDSHFRVTRALRPIFLVDNHYCGGIRRVIRQIMQSMPPILDMLFLLCFFMLIFSLLGFYLFSPNLNDPNFTTLEKSFVNLFVLITTANYPDVMMPAYEKNRWSVLFFIAFLVIHLYFLMNLMLAVVYETFTRIEKEKFRKLLLHRRAACQNAFRLLVPKSAPTRVTFEHFVGLMRYYKPRANKLDVFLMFKTLDADKSSFLSLEEFYEIYEVAELNWRRKHPDTPWYVELGPGFLATVFGNLHDFVTSKFFEGVVYAMIMFSTIYQVFEAATYEKTDAEFIETSMVTLVIVCFYGIEVCMKIIGLGITGYFASGWNVFDFLVTVLALMGLVTESIGVPFAFIFILRSLRLLKLFELKKRYKDIVATFTYIIMKRLGSVSVVVLVVYYFYAIIGMELFAKYNLKDCCKSSPVEQYFSSGTNSSSAGYYYLNNFSNLAASFVTLFELMVVNNWFILMEGYALVSNDASRFFFMSFYIVTMIVMTIVVAFVLDAFLFRIQYKRKMGDIDLDTVVVVDVTLTVNDLSHSFNFANSMVSDSVGLDNQITYHGSRTRTKFSFCMKMYAEEVREWLEKAEDEERQALQLGLPRNTSHETLEFNRRTMSCLY